jgi:hypothetical protein
MHSYLKEDILCLCALDMAYTDFTQKKSYMTIGTILQRKSINRLHNRIASIEKMVSKMKELPWPIYKIKLGTQ